MRIFFETFKASTKKNFLTQIITSGKSSLDNIDHANHLTQEVNRAYYIVVPVVVWRQYNSPSQGKNNVVGKLLVVLPHNNTEFAKYN